MKKGLIKLLGLLIISLSLLISVPKLSASTGTISVTANSNSVMVGDYVYVDITLSSSEVLGAWKYAVSYDSSKLKLEKGSDAGAPVGDGSQRSQTVSLTFKVIASGTSTISLFNTESIDFSGADMSLSVGSTTIKGITYQELEASYSKNNNLSSIKVNDYELTPAFDKDTLEYNVKVPSSVEKVTISADREDSTASVSGTGEFDVTEGDNKFELVVTAQNGGKKTYTVKVIVEDENPIIKEIDGEKYTVIKRKSTLTAPSTYKETTIKINNIEIPAFISEITGYTLVGMKNSKGESHLFIYDKEYDTYTLYREIKTESIIIFPKKTKVVPDYYKITEVTINGEKVEAYQYDGVKEYYLIYGVNIQTNEEGFYEYDVKNNTITRYNDKIIKELTKKIDNYELIIIVLGGETAFLVIVILIMLITRNKNKRKKDKIISKENKTEELIKDERKKEKKVTFKDFDKALNDEPEKIENKEEIKKSKKEKNKTKENML